MFFSYLWKTFKFVVGTVTVILFVRTFMVETGRVNGVSMEPTYFDNETFLVNKFSLLLSPPKRGQVIQCKNPASGALLIKRVIGLPGETVQFRDNKVFVTDSNGNFIQLNETYLGPDIITKPWDEAAIDPFVLKKNEYFILGDNRRQSADSRHFGPISRDEILGAVFFTL